MTDENENETPEGGTKRKSFLRRFVRFVIRLAIWVIGFFVFVFGGAWLWFESSSSDVVLAQNAEAFLEKGLNRDVSIGDLSLRPGLPAKLVVKDVRLANAEGALPGDQITLEKVELRLSLRALLRGKIRISDVVLVRPTFVLEVLPDGDGLTTNIPKWSGTSQASGGEQPDLDVDSINVEDGTFELIDHVHDLGVVARAIEVEVDPNLKSLSNPRAVGRVEIGSVVFRAATVEFPSARAASRVRFEERVLWVDSFTAQGNAMKVGARGTIRANRLDLEATLDADLEKLQSSLGLTQALRGLVEARAGITGFYADVDVKGTFAAPDVLFDVYGVTDVSGSFGTIDRGFEVVAETAKFGGGTANVRYAATSREGEPANVLEIRHEGVSVEEVLGVWELDNTGLLALASGELRLAWDSGSPEEGLSGTAVITPDPDRKTKAEFGTPIEGRVSYRLAGGALHLESVELESETTRIDLDGTIGLGDPRLDLRAEIQSTDFVDVDRLWSDLAHAFGQENWQLLEIGGRGRINAAVTGAMDAPTVDISVNADGFRYGDLDLERADGRVVFDGVRQELVFHDVRFENGQGEIMLRDRIGLAGEEIELALEVGLNDWETESILKFLDLEFPVRGLASGNVTVTGPPSAGGAKFSPLEIIDDSSSIKLSGDVAWTQEEKGLSFNLDVGLGDVPVETVAGVLDLGSDLPLSGATTGTVHLEGPLTDVSGAGLVVIRGGTLLGEPVDTIASDLVLSDGVFRMRNLDIKMPAGFVRGEAKIDFAQDRFGYVIEASEIDISKLEGYPKLRNVLTGKLVVSSSGAGTLEDPEVVLDLRVIDAVLLEVPVVDPGVRLYFTLRDGEFSAKGSVGEVFSLDGAGALNASTGAVDGNVSVSVSNIANILRRFEKRTGISVRGRLNAGVNLSGTLSPVKDLVVDGRIDSIDLKLAEHTVRTAEPVRFSLSESLFAIESFRLLVDDQTFAARGTIAFDSGAVDLEANGLIEAGLLAAVMPDLRANGDIRLALSMTGTLDEPSIEGTAEIRNADFRIQGFPQAFRGVKSTLVLSDNLIEIDSFSAQLGGGVVSAGGRIELSGGVPNRIRINARGQEVDLRLSQGLSVEGGFDLILAGNPTERMLLQGDAKLTRVLYTKDLELGTAIVDFIVSRRAKVETIGQEWESRVGLDVNIDAADAIRVRNNLATVTGSADVRVSGTIAQPVMLGRALIDEGGLLRISNVEYRVVNGSVNFQNPFRIDPFVDLTAEGRYRNEYDLTIVVTGTPDALQMAVSSDPPIADLSILNVFGIQTSTSTGTVNTRDSVSSAGESIIDSSVGSIVGSKLSFADNLRLEGLTGPEPRVTIEKSISNDVRAVVTYTMNDAGDNIQIIEWRASPRFLIQATRDSTKDTTYVINAIDVSFSRRFGGQW